ncbi:MAG: double-strand break repair helicase AddA [Sphingomonas bacterium]|nr:double-strand break repair helicase AddA [Sphingomonas bacterium]MDB5688778.1 double-strand break repair helicase AddA [Sphingomonas bacterium]
MARLKPLDPLKDEQLRASDPAEHIWLSASAGTGKTHVLSSRVLRLLLHGADPSAILCLTFTKAGAAEMADRIHARLAYWVQAEDKLLRKELFALGEPTDDGSVALARTLFARVLDAPGGGLRIVTIHAFCQSLLASFPVEAGLTPGFRPLDGRAEASLARSTLADLIDAAERGGDLRLIDDVRQLSRRLGEGSAEAYLLQCARAAEAMESLGAGIEAKVRTALDLPLGDVEDVIAAACADDRLDLAGLRAIAAANAAWGTKQGLRDADRIAAFLAASPEERTALVCGLVSVAQTATGDARKHSAKLLNLCADYPDLCTRLGDLCSRLAGLRSRAALATLVAAGLRAGQAYARAYVAAKRAAGVVDFEDLIRAAHALLIEPGMGEWVRYKLDQHTDHILVDEAQDTNARQWAIVAALAAEFFAGAGARGRRHRTMFTVGDFKQAIFGFQGTDPAAFQAAGMAFAMRAEATERPMVSLSLDRSFRSTPPVLALVDRLLDELGHENLGLEAAAPPHLSARSGLSGTVTLWRPHLGLREGDGEEQGEEGWIDDATRAFAAQLARQVREWLAEPLWLESKGRPLRPEDVLILVRRRGDLASLIVARLHAEGVAVAGVDRLRLTAPLAVRDLLAAVRFALQPDDDLNLANLLVSPLFGWSQDDLYAVAHGRKGRLFGAVRSAEDRAETAAGLAAILARADFITPYQFLEAILSGPLDGRRKLLGRLGEEARDPIEELLNAALQFEGEATPSLQRFLDWFDRAEVEIIRDPSAPADAVRVMTVHGAKGLQAPLVILADATVDPEMMGRQRSLSWPVHDDATVPLFRPRKDELHGSLADTLREAERRDMAEHWRLLYVAVTRAEERLVVGGALGPRMKGEAPAQSWYSKIDAAMAGLGAEWEEDPLWSGARHHRGGEARARKAARERTAPPPTPEPAWLRAPAPQEARPPRPLAPSSIGPDLVADPPPSPALRDAARRGTLLHALFERLPALPTERRTAAAAHWLTTAAPDMDEVARHDLVRDACAIIGDPAYADLFGPDGLAEAPIAAVVGGEVIAGTVDRLLVTETRVLVVDFKTGRRVPTSAEAAPEHHLRQMAAYVAALEVVFPGRSVAAALLYTAGPLLLPLPEDVLRSYKPGLAATEQILAPGG